MQYANLWNANPSQAHFECKYTQCVNLCYAQASNARATPGLARRVGGRLNGTPMHASAPRIQTRPQCECNTPTSGMQIPAKHIWNANTHNVQACVMHKQAMHELCVAAPCLSRSCWCHMPGVSGLVVAAWLLHGRDLPHNRNFFARCCWQCLGCLPLMVSGQIAAPAAVWACCSAGRTNVVFSATTEAGLLLRS